MWCSSKLSAVGSLSCYVNEDSKLALYIWGIMEGVGNIYIFCELKPTSQMGCKFVEIQWISLNLRIQSGHNFAHVSQQLSSCGMWKILAWLDHPIYEESLFLQDLDFEILNSLWNRSLVSSHAAHLLKKKSFLYCCWKTYILPDESLQMSSESPLVISFIEAQQCHVAF